MKENGHFPVSSKRLWKMLRARLGDDVLVKTKGTWLARGVRMRTDEERAAAEVKAVAVGHLKVVK
jgi:hypothetical protein